MYSLGDKIDANMEIISISKVGIAVVVDEQTFEYAIPMMPVNNQEFDESFEGDDFDDQQNDSSGPVVLELKKV